MQGAADSPRSGLDGSAVLRVARVAQLARAPCAADRAPGHRLRIVRSVAAAASDRSSAGTGCALGQRMSFNLDPSALTHGLTRALGAGASAALGGSSSALGTALATGASSWLGGAASFLGTKPTADAATLLPLVRQLLQALQPLAVPGAAASPADAVQGGAPAAGHGSAGASRPKASRAAGKTEKLDGPGGFLWKPVSDSNGKLVVLLPSKLAGQAKSVEVQDASGRTLAKGRYTGDANGGRPHFRFDKPGAAFGQDVRVVATLADGRKVSYAIKNGAARND